VIKTFECLQTSFYRTKVDVIESPFNFELGLFEDNKFHEEKKEEIFKIIPENEIKGHTGFLIFALK
jgi:hypothetical protein